MESSKIRKSFRTAKKGGGSWVRSISFPEETIELINQWRDLFKDHKQKKPNFSYSVNYLIRERFILRSRMVNIQLELDATREEKRDLKKELDENKL